MWAKFVQDGALLSWPWGKEGNFETVILKLSYHILPPTPYLNFTKLSCVLWPLANSDHIILVFFTNFACLICMATWLYDAVKVFVCRMVLVPVLISDKERNIDEVLQLLWKILNLKGLANFYPWRMLFKQFELFSDVFCFKGWKSSVAKRD